MHLSRVFQEWLYGYLGFLAPPTMLLVLWGRNRWSLFNWLAYSRKRWLALWAGYGLVRGIAVEVFAWARYLGDSGSVWPMSGVSGELLTRVLGHSPAVLLFATFVDVIFEASVGFGLAALSWWVYEWSQQVPIYRRTTILFALTLLIPSAVGVLAGGSMIVWPLPGLVVIPSLFVPFVFALTGPMILFLLWNPQLFRGEAGLPKRTYFLFAGTVLLSVLWFARGWSFGLKSEGPHFTYVVSIVNGLWALALGLLLIRSWKRPSFTDSLLLHLLLFAWLGWYAFPHFGELP